MSKSRSAADPRLNASIRSLHHHDENSNRKTRTTANALVKSNSFPPILPWKADLVRQLHAFIAFESQDTHASRCSLSGHARETATGMRVSRSG